jgi:hypothetical protein
VLLGTGPEQTHRTWHVLCHDEPMADSFTWPHEATPLAVAPLRPTLEHLQALVSRYPDVLDLIDPLGLEDDESDESELVEEDARLAASDATVADAAVAGAAGGSRGTGAAGATPEAGDPSRFLPPALAHIADEFGGIRVRGQQADLAIVVDERSDLGPYTLLTDPVSFTPLYEGEDVAVVLSIDPSGAPGPVYGIDEDLALVLAGDDLADYLQRYTHALDEALAAADPAAQDPTAGGSPSAQEVAEHMQEHFFDPLVGSVEASDAASTVVPSAPSDTNGLPAGTIAVADLHGASVGIRVDVMEADVPDPLNTRVGWGEGGRTVLLVQS